MPIIVAIQGGLGNQMFQYAFALSLKQQGKQVLLDTSFYNENKNEHNGYELEGIFNIDEQYSTAAQIKPYKDRRRSLSARIGKHVLQKYLVKYYEPSLHEMFTYAPNHFVYDLEDIYLSGFWQSQKFFTSAKEHVIKAFNLNHLRLSSQNKNVAQHISKSNSIGIHVRRGDYIGHPLLGEICTKDYYRNAIEKIQLLIENPVFFVFSNDITWCKEELNIKNEVTFIDWNIGKESIFDLYLMSHCKHNIIANSSFSWWAAYLNLNLNKIICAPDIWFKDNKINSNDIYQPEWIKINGDKRP